MAPRQTRIVWAEDPAHHAIVSWSTNGRGQVHEVYYDTASRSGVVSNYAFRSTSALNGAYDGGALHYHHAELSGLSSSTTYYFVIVSDGQVAPERHFVTAPEDDRPFKLLYGGDSRSNRSSRQGMNRRMAQLFGSDPTILALWHGGDYIATGSNLRQWSDWLDDHELTVTHAGRVLPLIPARGNHEGNGVLYNAVMAWPGGMQVDYFATRIGLNTVLITLDSNSAQGGTQRNWLDRSLREAQSRRWILANYHRPAYPAVKRPGGALQHWVPLFEQHNVDLVCESDGHVLKRTVPIRNGAEDPTGIVYVGEGGLGVSQRSPNTGRWYLRGSGMARSGHHVQVLSLTPERLTYEAILLDGSVADRYVARPRRSGTVMPSPQPPPPGPGPIPPPDPQPSPPPFVALNGAGNTVEVVFNVSMDASTTDVAGNYALSWGARVVAAVTGVAGLKVRLTTSPLTPNQVYTVTTQNLRTSDGSSLPVSRAQFRAGTGSPSPPAPPGPRPSPGGSNLRDGPVPPIAGSCRSTTGSSTTVSLLLILGGWGLAMFGRQRTSKRRSVGSS